MCLVFVAGGGGCFFFGGGGRELGGGGQMTSIMSQGNPNWRERVKLKRC